MLAVASCCCRSIARACAHGVRLAIAATNGRCGGRCRALGCYVRVAVEGANDSHVWQDEAVNTHQRSKGNLGDIVIANIEDRVTDVEQATSIAVVSAAGSLSGV